VTTPSHLREACFGLPSVFHQESERCGQCGQRSECEPAAYARLIGLQKRGIAVGDALVRFQTREEKHLRSPGELPEVKVTIAPPERTVRPEKVRLALSPDDQAALERLPVKVAKKVRLMMQKDEDRQGREALKAGRNPFNFEGARYLNVACDLLLSGGFTRASLRNAYCERLEWTTGTAASHVSTVVNIFPLFKFACETQQGAFVLHPAIKRNT
jgi:hypothetical protein